MPIEDVIERPLYLILALVVVVIVIPVAAGVSIVGTSASAGLISMNTTIASFMPLFGVGLAIGLTLAFIGLITRLRNSV